MDSEHSRNIQRWLDYIEANNLKKSKYWFPIDRLIHRMGFRAPPSVFWSFKRGSLTLGLAYGLLLFLGMSLIELYDKTFSFYRIIILSVSGAVFYGPIMGFVFLFQRRKMKIGTWEEFVIKNKDT